MPARRPGNTAPDPDRGLERLTVAASCGIIPAQEELTKRGIPLPGERLTYGMKIVPPSTQDMKLCGAKDSVTAFSLLGMVVVAPVLVAAGVVLLPVLIVGFPAYCGTKRLFTGDSCLKDYGSSRNRVGRTRERARKRERARRRSHPG